MTAYEYAEKHHEAFVDQLAHWLKIPSISTDPAFKPDIQRAAEWLAEDMTRIGLENVQILPTGGHPVVYADWLHAGVDKPTILVYGHYDVQPAVIEDGWTQDPFTPRFANDRIYARGASDDKGLVMCQLKAMEALLATGGSPVNVKYLIEGEEESGSENLQRFIQQNTALLQADVCLISDTGVKSLEEPLIIYGLRGLVTMDVIVSGPKRDLHSGLGGNIHNPIQALSEILAQLHHPDGRVNVDGFYDDIPALTDEERAELSKAEDSQSDWEAYMGDLPRWGEPGFNNVERRGARPTLEINGIAGGYAGEGFKTVLPAKAWAKVSCRLVPNQDPHTIFERVKAKIMSITPPTVRVEVKLHDSGKPAMTPIDHPATQSAVRAYAKHWGNSPLFVRMGGSIPVVADFQSIMNLPVVLLGFALPDSGAHGPDENFNLTAFKKGVATIITYLHEVSTMTR